MPLEENTFNYPRELLSYMPPFEVAYFLLSGHIKQEESPVYA